MIRTDSIDVCTMPTCSLWRLPRRIPDGTMMVVLGPSGCGFERCHVFETASGHRLQGDVR